MRITAQAVTRVGEPDHRQQLGRARAGGRFADLVVDLNRLDKLRADSEEGVQRGERILKDHRDLVAADRAHLLLAGAEQVLAVEDRLAAYLRVGGARQAHDRQRANGLAGARFADDAERLSWLNLV